MSNTAGKDEGGVHRLKDMLVEEVSLVDRAANKRRFALVKRSSDMSKRVVPDGRGGFMVAKAEGEDETEETEETEKAKPGMPFGGGDAGASPEDDKDDEEDDEEKAKKAAAAPPPFGGNKAPPFGGKPGGKAPPFGGKPKGEDDEEDDKKKSPPPFPPKKEKVEDDEEDEEKAAAKKALGVITPALEKLVGVAKDLRDKGSCSKADFESAVTSLAGMLGGKIEKRGARMAKERLERFQKAIDMLGTILKELIAARNEVEEEAGGEKKTKTKKSDDRVAELTAEINRLRKSVGIGNGAGAPERAPARKADEEVHWGLDMNAPTPKKGLSFAE